MFCGDYTVIATGAARQPGRHRGGDGDVPDPVATVTVAPASVTARGGRACAHRDAAGFGGAELTGRVITWSSDAAGVAAVSPSGMVTGMGPGSATITATREGVSATATITVTAPTGGVVFVGAGDIADCGSSGDEATAALLDGIAGAVFTTSDSVYNDGSATSSR
jgi:hypothetical protein